MEVATDLAEATNTIEVNKYLLYVLIAIAMIAAGAAGYLYWTREDSTSTEEKTPNNKGVKGNGEELNLDQPATEEQRDRTPAGN